MLVETNSQVEGEVTIHTIITEIFSNKEEGGVGGDRDLFLFFLEFLFGWCAWELRLYDENLSVPQSQCQNASGELGDVGGGGRLRCLHGKVDTTISRMYMYM